MAKKRADGRLCSTFTVNGKRYYVYGRTKAELKEKELAKREEIEKGYALRKNPTVSEYYERWTESRRQTIAESTLRGQIKQFNAMAKVVIPDAGNRKFGDLKIQEITIDDLRTLQNELQQSRRTQTVNDYLSHLKHVMNDAMKERVIDYNPAVLLKPLKRTEERARDKQHRALTLEEQKALFECDRTKESSYYNVFRFAILTGMRCGEIGALKNSDIRNGMIHVERTITRTETGSYKIGDSAKTEAGRRTIPITPEIQTVLNEQKEINALLDGNVVRMNDTIFKASQRGLLMATPVDRELAKACAAAGIEKITMHAFRATFATRCIESGMNPRTLQEILGHANFNITMSLYGHCLEDTKIEAMNSMKIMAI